MNVLKYQIRGPILLLGLFCPQKITLNLRNTQFLMNMAVTVLQDIKIAFYGVLFSCQQLFIQSHLEHY